MYEQERAGRECVPGLYFCYVCYSKPSDYNPSVPATCLRFPPNRCNPFRIALSLMATDGELP
jgi:hypothetical protein